MKYADWYLAREAEKSGLVVSMTSEVGRERSEMNNELAQYFRQMLPNYHSYFDEDKCDDVLFSLNSYISDHNIDKYEMDFPINAGTDIHLLKVTDNLQLKILIVDEYYGGGDYKKYIQIGHFLINENTTKEDVDALIYFINKYLNIQ